MRTTLEQLTTCVFEKQECTYTGTVRLAPWLCFGGPFCYLQWFFDRHSLRFSPVSKYTHWCYFIVFPAQPAGIRHNPI